MHRRISEVLERHQGGEENLQELAMHLTEGRCGAKAIPYALRAARASKAEFAHESALRFYDYLLHKRKHPLGRAAMRSLHRGRRHLLRPRQPQARGADHKIGCFGKEGPKGKLTIIKVRKLRTIGFLIPAFG